MKYGNANESVALTEYVFQLTTQSVTINLIQPGLILSKLILFLGYQMTLL